MAAGQTAHPHLLLQNAGDQFGLHGNGVFPVHVVQGDLQGIDMVGAVGGYLHHHPAPRPGDGPVLALGVDDNYFIISGEDHVVDGGLHAHRFARAGHAQVEGVGGDQPLAVTDQQVLGNGVDTIGQPAGVLYLLDAEGHKDGGALGGQGAHGLHPAQAVGQDGVQPVLLLVAQNGELAQVLPSDGKKGVGVRVKLLQVVRDMHQCHHGEHHPLVPFGEVGQKFLGLPPKLFQVIGDRGGEVVLVVLALLPAGDVYLNAHDPALNLPHRLVGGDGQDINRQHEVSGEVRQGGNHAVLDVAGVILEEQDAAHLVPHLKIAGPEPHTVRADQVLEVQAPPDGGGLVEGKILFLAGAEKVVEDAEPVMVGHGPGPAVQPPEALGQVGVHPPEIGPGFLDLPLGDGQGDVLLLDKIIALGGPLGEDAVGFPAVLIQAVPPLLHQNGAFKVHGVQTAVDDGDFGGGVGGQAVEHPAVG